jgi:hypothetical protein
VSRRDNRKLNTEKPSKYKLCLKRFVSIITFKPTIICIRIIRTGKAINVTMTTGMKTVTTATMKKEKEEEGDMKAGRMAEEDMRMKEIIAEDTMRMSSRIITMETGATGIMTNTIMAGKAAE